MCRTAWRSEYNSKSSVENGRSGKANGGRSVAAVALGVTAMFVLLVNSSVSFALAASRVPIIGALVEAVVLDPSLKAAVLHEYVQLVDETYAEDGITLEVEYLIADPKNLSIFYRVYDETGGISPYVRCSRIKRARKYRQVEAMARNCWHLKKEIGLHKSERF